MLGGSSEADGAKSLESKIAGMMDGSYLFPQLWAKNLSSSHACEIWTGSQRRLNGCSTEICERVVKPNPN